MALMMQEKKTITREVAKRYQRTSKKGKGLILDEFVRLTGYTRSHAAFVLRNWGRTVRVRLKGKDRVVILGGKRKKSKRIRERKYDQKVLAALKKIWGICDCICGKRLAPYLCQIIPVLEGFGELNINDEVREKLFKISPATIDRLLVSERRKFQLKGRSTTKPGTLLKNQIPVRTFSDWDEKKPGFVEVDLVSHDGGNARGDYCQTLDLTDVCTTWTETKAVKNKAQRWVFEALKEIKDKVPFSILGIDSDNGSEFINDQLFRFCQEKEITFTRSRPYRKNDNCFVEQKNYSVVRKTVGYLRYDTEEELKILNELYGYLRLYTNFFQPVMKLVEKTRVGSKVKKRYDQARTPYRRVLESPHILKENKERLKQEYVTLNPADLKRKITKLQNKLIRLTILKKELSEKQQQKDNQDFEYIFDEATYHAFV